MALSDTSHLLLVVSKKRTCQVPGSYSSLEQDKLRGRGFKEVAREPRGNGVVLYGADTGFSPLLL